MRHDGLRIAELKDVVKPVRRALFILLIAVVVVALGLLLAQDQETLRIRSAVPADDPRNAAYLAALVGADLTRGNRYDVLTNGDQIFPAMLGAINAARRANVRGWDNPFRVASGALISISAKIIECS